MRTEKTNPSRCRPQWRGAFTLVELLVVIAIIGVLVALLLPAIQSARESARRTQCANQLKQIGLALTTYHDARGRYPMGRDRTDMVGVSWAFEILPYMEQQAIHDSLRKGTRVDHPDNSAAMRSPVAEFFCPSRRSPAADRDFDNDDMPALVQAAAAGGDYAANSGTSTQHGMGATATSPAAKAPSRSEIGPLFSFSKVSARQVTDGLSKTLVVGEKHLPPPKPDEPAGRVHAEQGDTAIFAGDTRHTIFRRSSAGFPESRDELYKGHFGSEHSQLAQFVFLDGHVQSLEYDLDRDVFVSLSAIGDDGFIPDGVVDSDD